MSSNKPLFMYSRNDEGRHWLTTLALPPLQIAPVAANHCRVAYFLATMISSKLAQYQDNMPTVVCLTHEDVRVAAAVLGQDTDLEETNNEVMVRLVLEGAASNQLDGVELVERFITPRPMEDWEGTYDQWIFTVARQLGINAPAPADKESYQSALDAVLQKVRQKIPDLRQMYLQGMDEWKLRFKLALHNNRNDIIFVWLQPLDWSDEAEVVCMIESEPFDCDDYWQGRILRVPVSNLVDYSISSDAHLIEQGILHQVEEDYGRKLSHY